MHRVWGQICRLHGQAGEARIHLVGCSGISAPPPGQDLPQPSLPAGFGPSRGAQCPAAPAGGSGRVPLHLWADARVSCRQAEPTCTRVCKPLGHTPLHVPLFVHTHMKLLMHSLPCVPPTRVQPPRCPPRARRGPGRGQRQMLGPPRGPCLAGGPLPRIPDGLARSGAGRGRQRPAAHEAPSPGTAERRPPPAPAAGGG